MTVRELSQGPFKGRANDALLLRPETRLDAEDVAKAGHTGLEVELTALRQVGLLSVVVEAEERAATSVRQFSMFCRARDEDVTHST